MVMQIRLVIWSTFFEFIILSSIGNFNYISIEPSLKLLLVAICYRFNKYLSGAQFFVLSWKITMYFFHSNTSSSNTWFDLLAHEKLVSGRRRLFATIAKGPARAVAKISRPDHDDEVGGGRRGGLSHLPAVQGALWHRAGRVVPALAHRPAHAALRRPLVPKRAAQGKWLPMFGELFQCFGHENLNFC